MRRLLGVWGAAGCGRGLLPLVRAGHPDARIVFVDDGDLPSCVNGHDVLRFDAFLDVSDAASAICLAVADPAVRGRLDGRAQAAGLPLLDVRHSSVVQMDDVVIGEGACLSPFSVLTSNIRIGRAFHANIGSYVEHDCVVGDFVTFAPGVRCNGNVTIGDRAYVGSGAIIRQGVVIGAGAVVGMGAVVLRDVPAGTTVAGNPAHALAPRA